MGFFSEREGGAREGKKKEAARSSNERFLSFFCFIPAFGYSRSACSAFHLLDRGRVQSSDPFG